MWQRLELAGDVARVRVDRRDAVGGSLRSAGSTTGIGTGTRTGSGYEPRMGVPPVTTCWAIGQTTTRPGFRSCVRQSSPSSTRSIASDSNRDGLQSCSTSTPSPSIAWHRHPHVRRLRTQPDDRIARNGSNCRRGQRSSPGLRRFSRSDSGGSDAPRRRDGLAVATARASGDSRCRRLYGRSALRVDVYADRTGQRWSRKRQSPLEPELRGDLVNEKSRRRPTLPGGLPPSTIGAGGLNCRVRNGNGCIPAAMATGNLALGGRMFGSSSPK